MATLDDLRQGIISANGRIVVLTGIVNRLEGKLDQMSSDMSDLNQSGLLILQRERIIMKELDDLTTQVTANTDAEKSAITLINGIAARIAAAGVDPVKLTALSTSLKSSADALAAAVVANTPAA